MKLNVGCGKDVREGYVNLDAVRLPGVDVVHDINKKFPFPDNHFDEILANHVVEHASDLTKLMRELHRILKPGGGLLIETPHFTFANAYVDPTHLHFFSFNTFKYFVKGDNYNYYYDFSFSKISVRLSFNKKYLLLYNYALELIANLFPKVYEQTPLRLFPAENLHIVLVK